MGSQRERGCWTCRLRRKKCNGDQPCSDCLSLGIDCCYQIGKPAWMDNGVKQRQKAEEIKSEIKRNASQRRTQRKIRTLAQQLEGAATLTGTPVPTEPILSSKDDGSSVSSGEHTRSSTILTPDATTLQESSPRQSSAPSQAAQSQELLEDVVLMAYLDYLFPVIYPFYRTSLAKGGRVWILSTIRSNVCVRHGIIALASHLLVKVQGTPQTSIQLCEALDDHHMHRQTQTALQSALNALEAVRSRGIENNVVESSRMFCSIVQLLVAESHIGKSSWRLHLDGAVSLLRQLIDGLCCNNDPGTAFDAVIDELGVSFILQRPNPPLFTPDQAAFRFYTATLILSDTIASTSREQQPRLHHYSTYLLKNDTDDSTSSKLDVADLFGLQRETLLLISATASLAAWKKDKAESQQLSMPELVKQAEALEVRLGHHLAELGATAQKQCDQPSLAIDFLSERGPLPSNIANTINRIWALATKTYLFVTVSGTQLSHPVLRSTLSETLDLLAWLAGHDTSPVAAWLRALAWPVCVTGLLVQSSEEKQSLRNLLCILDPLMSFGAVRNLRETIERAWEQRERASHAGDTHHMPSLGSLMGGALLI